jgi:hypothetical protein
VRNFVAFAYTLPIFIASLGGMYVFWYRNLPPDEPGQTTNNSP